MYCGIVSSSCVGTDPLPALYVKDEPQTAEMDTRRQIRRMTPSCHPARPGPAGRIVQSRIQPSPRNGAAVNAHGVAELADHMRVVAKPQLQGEHARSGSRDAYASRELQ
jgi:hypothetical protein